MVDIIGRAKVIVESDVDKGSLDSTGGKIGAGIKTGALVGAAALGTLAVAGVKAIDAFAQAEAQSRKLNQVLDNMGQSAAGPAVEKYADSLSRVVGVDDEVIKQGQTVLATFSQVAESAGNTGGVFERATAAAVDLAATGFGSVESASVMLGKALQDPEKGITALSRAGVTFTEEQKTLIEGFLAVNDVASAQAIILGEVERQVGGTAEASVTEGERIKTAMGEIQEAIGHALGEATGGEIDGVSDALFTLSDKINEMAESEDWQRFGKNLRDVASDGAKVAEVLGDIVQEGHALDKALPEWTEDLGLALNPVGKLADALDTLYKAYKKLKDLVSTDSTNSDLLNKTYKGGDLESLLTPSFDAVGGPASGWTVVGERGPELLNLPPGSYVNSAANSQEMLTNGGGNVFYVQTTGTVDDIVRELDWWARFGPVTA